MLVLTANHTVFTKDGWKKVSDLKVGDEIVTHSGVISEIKIVDPPHKDWNKNDE